MHVRSCGYILISHKYRFNKYEIIYQQIFIGAALFSMTGLVSCVGDLDQLPNDPNSITSGNFGEDPQKYLSEVMAKCYSSLAVSGQGDP